MIEPPPDAAPTLEAATGAGEAFPWPPAGISIATAIAQTWRGAVFDPTTFYGNMPVPGPAGPAILYFLVIGIAAAAVRLFWRLTFHLIAPASDALSRAYAMLGLDPSALSGLVEFLLSPLVLGVELVFAFAVFHTALWVLGGARRGAKTTLRTLCYAYSPNLFLVVPILGGFVGSIWMIVVVILGLRTAHRTETWRVAVAVLVPIGGFVALGAALLLLATLLFGV